MTPALQFVHSTQVLQEEKTRVIKIENSIKKEGFMLPMLTAFN